MAVPSTFADLSTTPASNSGLISDASAVNVVDDHLRSVYALIASVYANSGNGWSSPYLTAANPSYTGTLTGGTGVVNLGSGQFYKDASGNVGIGTTSPSGKLTVAGGALLTQRGASNGVSTADFRIYNTSSGNALSIDNYTDVRFHIDSSGNVGIGTSTPTQKLSVAGNVAIADTGSAPSTPSSGGVLYVESGALKYRGSSGTVSVLAPA